MHSCEEGAIVSGVRQAGLIIVQGKSGPAWTEERLLAVTSQSRWCDGLLWLSTGGWEGHAHTVKVKSQLLCSWLYMKVDFASAVSGLLRLSLAKMQVQCFWFVKYFVLGQPSYSSSGYTDLQRHELLSHMHCTPELFQTELQVWTYMSDSLGTDINWTLPCPEAVFNMTW